MEFLLGGKSPTRHFIFQLYSIELAMSYISLVGCECKGCVLLWVRSFDILSFILYYSIVDKNVVFVSDIQKSDLDSCIYLSISIYTHILFQILFHHGLLQDIAYSSLCFTVEPCCSSVYTWYCVSANPELLIYPSPLALW